MDSEEICRNSAAAGDLIGDPCKACGHTNLVHPQPFANPNIDACVLCELQAELHRLRSDHGTDSRPE